MSSAATTIEKKHSECADLPPGWRREEIISHNRVSQGKIEVSYYSPDGTRIRNKQQLSKFLGDRYDLTNFDFKTGKLTTPNTFNPSIVANLGSHVITGSKRFKGDSSTTFPIRQTASIFKQPVTLIKNHYDTKTRTDLKHGPQQQPIQLYWFKRFGGLNASDISGDSLSLFDLPSAIQSLMTPELVTCQSLVQSIAACLHNGSHPIVGQTASVGLLQKNPCVNLNVDQPLIQNVAISDEDIRKQEAKVIEARKRLQMAIN